MSLAELYFCLGAIFWLFVTGVGIVPFVPEELAVFGVGTFASKHNFTLWLPWLSCIIGILGTDLVLYGIGRLGGPRFFELGLVKRFIPFERRQRILEGFHNNGAKFLASGRLLPGVRTAIFMVAGAIHFPLHRFIVADLVSIPIVSIFYFGSYFFAEMMARLIDNLHKTQYVVLFLLIVGGGGYLLWRWLRFIHRRTATNDFSPPHLPHLPHLPLSLPGISAGTGSGTEQPEKKETVPMTPRPVTTEHPLLEPSVNGQSVDTTSASGHAPSGHAPPSEPAQDAAAACSSRLAPPAVEASQPAADYGSST